MKEIDELISWIDKSPYSAEIILVLNVFEALDKWITDNREVANDNTLRVIKKHQEFDRRISKLEGGIVASADALSDLEYRHLKRIEALEASKKYHDEEIRKLRGQVAGLALAAGEDGHRITALEEAKDINGRHIDELMHHYHEGDSQPRWWIEGNNTTPLPCCEGCASESFCKRPEHMDFGKGQHPREEGGSDERV